MGEFPNTPDIRPDLRIAVNTRLLLSGKLEGIGWFSYQTLKRMVQSHPEHHFIFLFDRPYDERFIFGENVEPVVIGPQARHPVLYKIWFDYRIPGILKKLNADVFISPDGFLSLRSAVPSLAVIHDLNFEAHPGDLPRFASAYYRKNFPRFAKRAHRIATVSEFSKQDIVNRYKVSARKIDVVYNGVNSNFQPLSEADQESVRADLTGGRPYFIYVGSQNPRKNLQRLFMAFDQFCASGGEDARLVMVGEKMFWNREMYAAYDSMVHKDKTIFLGRLDGDQLNRVLSSAVAMTLVSYFEGFGIPVLESFAAGTPVLLSDKTSLPEVAGEAALYVDPYNVEDIAAGMKRMIEDPALRRQLIEKGSQRLGDFSWDRTAELLWRSVEEILPE